jgi:hypothetical protein
MTVDEARAAVNNATETQLALRAALYQIDGIPISQMISPKPALIASPKNRHKKPRSKNRIHAPDKQCPYCGEMKHPTGYGRHVAACKAKHPDTTLDDRVRDVLFPVVVTHPDDPNPDA